MNFDLNIENYETNELIEMFELPSNFDRNILEKKQAKLIENIMNNKEVNKETKVETIDFLTKAKNMILNTIQPEIQAVQKKIDGVLGELPPIQRKIEGVLSDIPSVQNKFQRVFNSLVETGLKHTNLEDASEHMVQYREANVAAPAHPVEFMAGALNPIKKRILKKSLNIDSRFRDNYYSTSPTNFNVNLPLNIENVLVMQLNAIQLPMTFYTISRQYGNNFFTIKVALNDGTVASKVIDVPSGNYVQLTIPEIINAQLLSSGAPFAFIKFQVNLTGPATGSGQTLVGTNPDVPGSDTVAYIELNFQADRNGLEDRNTPLPLKFGWMLGFRNGVYTGNLNYVSESLVDLSGPKYLFLVVDDYNNNVVNNFYSAFNSSILNKNILARIALPLPNFFLLNNDTYMLTTLPREYFGPVNLQTMTIQLLDEYGRIVDLNNMDFSFCLTLITLYDL
jgi:hypothetical protein